MQHWKSCKVLLYLNVILVMVLSLALMGCPDDSDHGDADNLQAAPFRLTAANAAALAGLGFTFADGSIFGPRCAADQPATLTFGEAGDTFILVCGEDGETTIDGTITYASCRFEDDDGPFNRLFPGCDCLVTAQNLIEGGTPDTGGFVQLSLTRQGETVVSDPTSATIGLDNNGFVTINDTPIGRFPTGGTGGTGD